MEGSQLQLSNDNINVEHWNFNLAKFNFFISYIQKAKYIKVHKTILTLKINQLWVCKTSFVKGSNKTKNIRLVSFLLLNWLELASPCALDLKHTLLPYQASKFIEFTHPKNLLSSFSSINKPKSQFKIPIKSQFALLSFLICFILLHDKSSQTSQPQRLESSCKTSPKRETHPTFK